MRGYVRIQRTRILGASLHVHWSAFVAAGIGFGAFIRQPLHAVILVLAYFGVILTHEIGHALVARWLGYRATEIYLTFFHGLCVYEHPDSEKEDAMIAWGGFLLELAVAVPLIALAQLTPLGTQSMFAIVVVVCGYFSVFTALFNLIPAQGLDGKLAWRLVPIVWGEMRQRASARKTAKNILRKFK